LRRQQPAGGRFTRFFVRQWHRPALKSALPRRPAVHGVAIRSGLLNAPVRLDVTTAGPPLLATVDERRSLLLALIAAIKTQAAGTAITTTAANSVSPQPLFLR
jgi:hypothetical protein